MRSPKKRSLLKVPLFKGGGFRGIAYITLNALAFEGERNAKITLSESFFLTGLMHSYL